MEKPTPCQRPSAQTEDQLLTGIAKSQQVHPDRFDLRSGDCAPRRLDRKVSARLPEVVDYISQRGYVGLKLPAAMSHQQSSQHALHSALNAAGIPWQLPRALLEQRFGIRRHAAYNWDVIEVETSRPLLRGRHGQYRRQRSRNSHRACLRPTSPGPSTRPRMRGRTCASQQSS